MLNAEIGENSGLFPEGFQRDYDAHIYYSNETRQEALALRARALQELRKYPIFIGPMVDRLVGPHPLPMFEIDFSRELAETIITWLDQARGSLTILIHEVTGDDPRDHSVGARWLGTPVKLDESKLDPSPSSK